MECPFPECPYATPEDASEAQSIAYLSAHQIAHMPGARQATATNVSTPRGPKLDRPMVDVGVSLEEWNVFTRRWDAFVLGSGLDKDACSSQLFQCAAESLGDALLKSNPNIVSQATKNLLDAMKRLAVIAVAPGVLRAELMQMRQDRDETFRAYAAKVRGKAETCGYVDPCPNCHRDVDHTDSMIRDVLIAGVSDLDIRRDVLSTENILQKPINDIVSLVEAKEMARNALPPSAGGISSFRRQGNPRQVNSQQNNTPRSQQPRNPQHPAQQTAVCPGCRNRFDLYTEGANG